MIWSCDVEEKRVSRGNKPLRAQQISSKLDVGVWWLARGLCGEGDKPGKPPDDVDVGDDPTLSTSGLGWRLKISRGSIHAHVHGTVGEWEPRLFGGTGT